MLNNQAPEKADYQEDGSVEVHSIFYTLQGEGPFTGQRSVFVRLAGCNIQCPGCDTEYTTVRDRKLPEEIIADIRAAIPQEVNPRRMLVVITGGEPLRQNIYSLVGSLRSTGFNVQVETNGILFPTWAHLLVSMGVKFIVSPKTSRIAEDWGLYATAFKYVLKASQLNPDDLLPLQALGHKASPQVARPPEHYRGPIYVNPMDEKDLIRNADNVDAVVEAALRHGYIAGIQLHKLVDLP